MINLCDDKCHVPIVLDYDFNSSLHLALSDFVPLSLDVVFDQSPSQMCVTISILDDTIPENDESFNVVLQLPSPPGVSYVSPTIATVTIGDNGNIELLTTPPK